MSVETFISVLSEKLKDALPGESAQGLMAPAYRLKPNWENIESSNPRISAVLVLLYPKEGQYYLLLMKRSADNGVHSAQVSFPGGKKEDGDIDIVHTALREANEEAGIAAEKVQVLGQLTRVYIPPSHFIVYPVLGRLEDAPRLTPGEQEVQYFLELSLHDLLDERIQVMREVTASGGFKAEVPAYLVQDEVVWGATAIILAELKALISPMKHLLP
jgi:8-oxo-dGTP pyrophosphatase MutT (NUDIX family)